MRLDQRVGCHHRQGSLWQSHRTRRPRVQRTLQRSRSERGQVGGFFDANDKRPTNLPAFFASLTDNDDGTYSLVYYPTLSGTVNLSISSNETEILGSPFTINIKVGGTAPPAFFPCDLTLSRLPNSHATFSSSFRLHLLPVELNLLR